MQARSRDEGSSHNVGLVQSGTTTLADTEPTVVEKGEEEKWKEREEKRKNWDI